MLLFVSYLLLRSSRAQNYISKKATNYFSELLHTKVEIKGVDVELFRKIVLEGVYIEDLHHDTLLYASKLKIDINDVNLKKRKLTLQQISIHNTRASLVQYLNEKDFNYQFIIDAFASKDTSKTDSSLWKVDFGDILLDNADFSYIYQKDTARTYGVNYSDIRARQINSKISNIKFDKDTIMAKIEYLSVKEKSGFVLQDFSCLFKISPRGMDFNALKIKTEHSEVATDLSFRYNAYEDILDFNNKVQMRARFDKTKVEMADIAYFAPALEGIQKSLILSGNISGRVNDLKGKKLDILLGSSSEFHGNLDIVGLPNIEETFIHLNVDRLTTNRNDLLQIPIPPFKEKVKLEIPEQIGLLGQVKFQGAFSGFFNDFVTYGTFSTALGEVSSDLAMQENKEHKVSYQGKIKSSDFNIGKFLALDKILGKISIDAAVDGSGLERDKVNATLKGVVKNIEFNNYNYQNLSVEATLSKKIFNGSLSVKDENLNMDFNGNIDFIHQTPTLNFVSNINKANFPALHFYKTNKITNFSARLALNIMGSNIDNFIGNINIDNVNYREDSISYKSKNISLIAEESDGTRSIRLNSDMADAEIKGKFAILELGNSFLDLFGHYLPSFSRMKKAKISLSPQDFKYSVQLKNTESATSLFLPKIKINPNTNISGHYNSIKNSLSVEGNSSHLELYGYQLNNWFVNLSSENDSLNMFTGCNRLLLGDSTGLDVFNINARVSRDKVDLKVKWNNKSLQKYNGDINALITFNNTRTSLKLLPSQLTVADSVWTMDEDNELVADSSHVSFKNFTLKSTSQSLKIEGAISENPNEQLLISLNNFNIANLNRYTQQFGLNLSGQIAGSAGVSDFYKKNLFTSDLKFDGFTINKETLGKGSIKTFWDKEQEIINVNGTFSRGIVPNLEFKGSYYTARKNDNIDFDVSLQAIRLEIFENYVKDYCSDFKGQLLGNMNIKGTFEKPIINGKLTVQAKKVRVNYLNTYYSFSSEINIASNYFGIEDMRVFDVYGNSAIINGKLYHKNFSDFQLDFDINTKKFMCLNTNEAQNNLYYGKAFASGMINIFGSLDKLNMDINAKTEKGTQFNIPLSGPSEVSENNFISFIKKDSNQLKIAENYKVDLSGLKLNFDLEVTPDAEVQLIFDSKIGDVIKGRGNGNIKMEISTMGDFKMYGDYNVVGGDYLFTLKNVINKRFEIASGGTIKWTGDPYDADINLQAIYKQKALLKPFFPTDSSAKFKKRYPVDCILLMNGKLMTPDISFDIDLPTVDEGTKQNVKDLIKAGGEQAMNKEIFSLLVMNSFVPPDGSTFGSAAETGKVNSSELLSNQLSNWLSQISNDFDIGVNYRPGDNLSSDQLEVALSTQLFNDRVILDINGSNNVLRQQQNSNNIVGEFNAEYKLSDDGKLRLKGFNKINDNISLTNNAPYKQGVGIFYREEFNTIDELFRRYIGKFRKKKTEKKI